MLNFPGRQINPGEIHAEISFPAAPAGGLADLATLLGSQVFAQQPQTVRIRGTIEAVDGPMLAIKSREGTDMKVKLTDNAAVFAVVKTELSEIKDGSYIGVTGCRSPTARRRRSRCISSPRTSAALLKASGRGMRGRTRP